MLRKLMLVACLLATFQTPAAAETTPPDVYGAGARSCGQWLTDSKDQSTKLIYQSWMLGYVSGYSLAIALDGGALAKTDMDAMTAWVDNYCRANPLELFAIAGTHLVFTLRNKAQLEAQQKTR